MSRSFSRPNPFGASRRYHAHARNLVYICLRGWALDSNNPNVASCLPVTPARTKALGMVGHARAGAPAIASPALGNATAGIHWTLTSAFNQSLDIMFGAAETFAQTVSDLTDGHFTISTSGPDQIASPVDALTAVVDGKADCAHTALSYSWNTNPAYIFGTGAPFGMNARQHAA